MPAGQSRLKVASSPPKLQTSMSVQDPAAAKLFETSEVSDAPQSVAASEQPFRTKIKTKKTTVKTRKRIKVIRKKKVRDLTKIGDPRILSQLTYLCCRHSKALLPA